MKPNVKWPSKAELKRAKIGPIMRPSMLITGFSQRANTRLRPHACQWKLRRAMEVHGIRVRIARHTNMRDLHALFEGYLVALIVGESQQVFDLAGLAMAPIVYKIEPVVNGKHVEVRLKRQHALKVLPRADGGRGFVIGIEVHGVRLWEDEKKSSRPGAGSSRAPSKKKTRRK